MPPSDSVRSLQGLQTVHRPRYLAKFSRNGRISDREPAWDPDVRFPSASLSPPPVNGSGIDLTAVALGFSVVRLRFGIAFASAVEDRVT